MAFDFGSALEGGVEGGAMGAQTGNPYIAIGAALGNAALKGFSSKKKSSGSSASGVPSGTKSGGFSPDMIMDILSKFTGGMGGGSQESAAGSAPQSPASPSQYIPPALVGFPSLSRGGVAESLKNSISKRRGF